MSEDWYPEYVTTGFIAKACGVSSTTVWRWIKNGLLPSFVLPSGHYRIHREDFKTFLANHRIMIRADMFELETRRSG